MKNSYPVCLYYVASLERSRCWFLASALRGTEHIAFDRALDAKKSIFEFFVPEATESVFLEIMQYMQKEGVVLSLEKLPNRLLTENLD